MLAELSSGHILARCLHVLADFGVADALGERPTAVAELAARTGLNADALERMLRLASAHGVFAASAAGCEHTPASRLLREDHPQSLRALVRMRGSPSMWDAFTNLAQAARTGKPARDWASLVSHFATHPDEAAIFDAGMVAKSLRVIPAVLTAYDFSPFGVVADIGGGHGHLLRAILARHAAATGVLFDVPHVVEQVRGAPEARVRLMAGDFFADELPVADGYLLMDLLHDWSDRDAAAILTAVRRAAPAHARVVIIETLVPESPDPHFGKTLDLIMLTVTGGRERTASEHGALLAGAGFRLLRVVATAVQYSIIEAAAA
jgi:hypothetical protein